MGMKYSASAGAAVLRSEARQMKQNSAGGMPPGPKGSDGGRNMGYSAEGGAKNLRAQESNAPMRSTGQDCNPAGG